MPSLPPKKQRPKTNTSYSGKELGMFYHTTAWRKLREYKRSLNPICELCEKDNKVVSMEVVDHIKPISEGGQPLHLDNLQSLCDQCHRKKTAIETNKRR